MNSKLPKVFVSKIDKVLHVNQEEVISTRSSNSVDLETILADKDKYLFMHKYLITLNDGKTLEDSIVSRKGDFLLTLNNKRVRLNDIKSIVELKK